MSRIGKKPIDVPSNVNVSVNNCDVTVEAGNNRLSMTHRPEVSVRLDTEAKVVIVERQDDERESKALHGLTRSLIQNMITGVTTGFLKELDIVGVGWNGKVQGNRVALSLGHADTKYVDIPAGIKVEINAARIKVTGADKQAVGQIAAEIRAKRPPEPYNGKGVRYVDETVVRKEGKAFGS